jgi:acyl dehydratase
MPRIFASPNDLKPAIGEQYGPTDWLEVKQPRIDQFADATGDHQWIHVDVEKAKTGPFGATVAHGYLTLSLVNYFLPQLIEVRGFSMGLNYGLDKVRFPNVVRAGARIRGRGELVSVETQKDGAIQATIRITIDIENQDKPACVADTISRYYPA